jgi:hypothetical protein
MEFEDSSTAPATHSTMYPARQEKPMLSDVKDCDIVVHTHHSAIKCITTEGEYYRGLLSLSENCIFPGQKNTVTKAIGAKYKEGLWTWTHGITRESAQQIDELTCLGETYTCFGVEELPLSRYKKALVDARHYGHKVFIFIEPVRNATEFEIGSFIRHSVTRCLQRTTHATSTRLLLWKGCTAADVEKMVHESVNSLEEQDCLITNKRAVVHGQEKPEKRSMTLQFEMDVEPEGILDPRYCQRPTWTDIHKPDSLIACDNVVGKPCSSCKEISICMKQIAKVKVAFYGNAADMTFTCRPSHEYTNDFDSDGFDTDKGRIKINPKAQGLVVNKSSEEKLGDNPGNDNSACGAAKDKCGKSPEDEEDEDGERFEEEEEDDKDDSDDSDDSEDSDASYKGEDDNSSDEDSSDASDREEDDDGAAAGRLKKGNDTRGKKRQRMRL